MVKLQLCTYINENMEKETLLDPVKVSQYKEIFHFENYLMKSDLSKNMKTLLKIRVSQINKCAFCIDLHTKDFEDLGESAIRITSINEWRENNNYNETEKALLALAEELSYSSIKTTNQAIEAASRLLDKVSMAQVIAIILATNFWNKVFSGVNDARIFKIPLMAIENTWATNSL